MHTYSLFLHGIESGFFRGRSPNEAARKIYRSVSRQINAGDEFEFEIIHVIHKRVYKYYGKRKEINETKVFTKNGIRREFICKYKYSVRRLYE
jgi:hypothetical protein